jgi:hypothetical protein
MNKLRRVQMVEYRFIRSRKGRGKSSEKEIFSEEELKK